MGKRRGLQLAVLLTLLGGLLVAVAAEAQDEMFVADLGNSSITVYSRTANGNTAPLRTLSGAATGLSGPAGLALDLTNNELIVANSGGTNSITVYSRTASGNTAPLRTLSGAATGLSFPQGLALDLTNNELFVTNRSPDSITVYSRTASGNTAPLRILSGAATGLNIPEAVALITGAAPTPTSTPTPTPTPTNTPAGVPTATRTVTQGAPAAAVPTLSEGMLLLLGASLALMSLLLIRRSGQP